LGLIFRLTEGKKLGNPGWCSGYLSGREKREPFCWPNLLGGPPNGFLQVVDPTKKIIKGGFLNLWVKAEEFLFLEKARIFGN